MRLSNLTFQPTPRRPVDPNCPRRHRSAPDRASLVHRFSCAHSPCRPDGTSAAHWSRRIWHFCDGCKWKEEEINQIMIHSFPLKIYENKFNNILHQRWPIETARRLQDAFARLLRIRNIVIAGHVVDFVFTHLMREVVWNRLVCRGESSADGSAKAWKYISNPVLGRGNQSPLNVNQEELLDDYCPILYNNESEREFELRFLADECRSYCWKQLLNIFECNRSHPRRT